MALASLHCAAVVGLIALASLRLNIPTPDIRLGECLKASSASAPSPRRLETQWLYFPLLLLEMKNCAGGAKTLWCLL